MSLVDGNGNGNGMVMPVAPMMGGYGGWGNGFGGFGGDGWWVILFLFALMGNGGWGGFGGFGGEAMFPYFFNSQTQNDVNRGFDTQNLGNQIQSVQSSVDALGTRGQLSDIQTSLNTGFANAEVADCNRAMNAMQTAYNNQIADMNQRFTLANAVDDRLDNLSMALQKCCCDNELATVRTQGIVQTEAAANRFQSAENTRDIITNATANTQRILDKLCDQELQAERRANDQLRQELNMANLAASQTAQTARLLADNAAQTQQIENYVRPQINPAYIVPNPYAYNFYPNNGWYGNGCGCNGGNFAGVA